MAEIMEVLSELGEFEWASRRPALKTSASDLAYPPIIVWRYKRPSSDGAERIARAVQSFKGSIPWAFSAARKNWGIMPSRLGEYTRANGLHGERVRSTCQR